MKISSPGEARFASPIQHPVNDKERIPADIVRDPDAAPRDEVLFELAGPRAKLFFDPAQTRAGIVTCGGLCPCLNNVIRTLFLELHHTYGVAEVLGFRGGCPYRDAGSGEEAHRHGRRLVESRPGSYRSTRPFRITDRPSYEHTDFRFRRHIDPI
jgi:6-phosphofructokinase 1